MSGFIMNDESSLSNIDLSKSFAEILKKKGVKSGIRFELGTERKDLNKEENELSNLMVFNGTNDNFITK